MRNGIGCWKKRTGDGGRASGGRAFGRAEPDVVVAGTAGHHGRLASGRHHGAVADERLFAWWKRSSFRFRLILSGASPRASCSSRLSRCSRRAARRQLWRRDFWVLLLRSACCGHACTRHVHAHGVHGDPARVPREKRGTAMGVIGLIIGFAPAVGPSVAGLLVDSVGWRALFAIVTVLSVVVIVLAVVVLRNYGNFARAPFDKLSVVLSTVGLVCVLYGLSTFALLR
ncbi:MAG: MFS transporter [Adlercreutzia equolifaciens]